MVSRITYDLSLTPGNLGSKGLFTWREGAPANRATQLTELPWEG